MESRALADGNVSPQERQRIQRAQNQESRQITRLENNGRVGDPNSPSSRRMQAEVRHDIREERRDLRQQGRFDQGARSGQLTNRFSGNDGRFGQNNNRFANSDYRFSHNDNRFGANASAGAAGNMGRSDLAPGRQPHLQQSPAQQAQVQHAQLQRTSAQQAPVQHAQSQASRPVTVARQGGYSGRHTR
jgi:hypothetical protein